MVMHVNHPHEGCKTILDQGEFQHSSKSGVQTATRHTTGCRSHRRGGTVTPEEFIAGLQKALSDTGGAQHVMGVHASRSACWKTYEKHDLELFMANDGKIEMRCTSKT